MLASLVCLMILAITAQSACCNIFAKNYPGDKNRSPLVYSAILGAIEAVVTFFFAGFSYKPSLTTVLFGILCGLILATYNLLFIKASQSGPFSITMIANLGGAILIPLFYSAVRGAQLSVWQYIAIVVMLVSFVLLNLDEKKPDDAPAVKEKVSSKFIIYAVLLGLANGVYQTLLSVQESMTNSLENMDMVMTVNMTMSAASFIIIFITLGKQLRSTFTLNIKSALSVSVAGVSDATGINLLMYLLGFINVAVVTSMLNGGVLILSILWSLIFFKEKLSPRKTVGLVLAIAAVVALSLL